MKNFSKKIILGFFIFFSTQTNCYIKDVLFGSICGVSSRALYNMLLERQSVSKDMALALSALTCVTTLIVGHICDQNDSNAKEKFGITSLAAIISGILGYDYIVDFIQVYKPYNYLLKNNSSSITPTATIKA